MSDVKKWAILGLMAWAVLVVVGKTISMTFAVIMFVLGHLPTLPWVTFPGIQIVWAVLVILGLGWLISLFIDDAPDMSSAWSVLDSMKSTYTMAPVVFSLEGGILRHGYLRSKVSYNGKAYAVITISPWHYALYLSRDVYLVPLDGLVFLKGNIDSDRELSDLDNTSSHQ
jgi:hypothetical protein